MDLVADLTAGSFGGGLGMMCGHPLDTIKVRMQNTPGAYTSMADCAIQTVRGEGMIGLMKGLPPPLISVAAYQAVAFASFSKTLGLLTDAPEDQASVSSLFLAGSISGVATCFVTTPADLIKIRLQLDTAGGGGISHMVRCARHIFATEGLLGFCRGMEATLYRDSWSTGLYFVSYHLVKRWLGTSRLEQTEGDCTGNAIVELTAGGVAGTLAWGSVVPFDVVKTRLQSQVSVSGAQAAVDTRGSARRKVGASFQETRFWPTFRHILQQEGWRRLYSGTAPLLVRAFIVNAVTFYVYEECWRYIKRFRTKKVL